MYDDKAKKSKLKAENKKLSESLDGALNELANEINQSLNGNQYFTEQDLYDILIKDHDKFLKNSSIDEDDDYSDALIKLFDEGYI